MTDCLKIVKSADGTVNSKMHNAGVRVLNLLKLLVQNDISINNIMQNMGKSFDDIEAPETILKYLTTLEFSGFEIKKINKKYSLCNSPERILCTEEETKLIEILSRAFKDSCLESERADFNEFLKRLSKIIKTKNSFDYKKIMTDELCDFRHKNSEIAQYYQNYVDLTQKLKIWYRRKIYTVEAKNVEIENDKIYLNVYCFVQMSMMKFLTEDIEKIEILPTKTGSINITDSVVFEVYDRLADNYRLRDCEKIQTFDEHKKVIVNSGEDKELLLKRLMKYGKNCKIISPKSFQTEFIEKIQRIKEKAAGIKK